MDAEEAALAADLIMAFGSLQGGCAAADQEWLEVHINHSAAGVAKLRDVDFLIICGQQVLFEMLEDR